MRITNRIMQRNNLSNINTNKIYQDKLSTQMSSQKKINRPSDDPVVAIRALRLRSNVTEITQYYTKNILDAESWLQVTEDAISNLADIIKSMISRCDKGVNSILTTQNRQIILEEMQNLGKSIYATGDSDYAGRYVFTGYRTDTSLSFLEAKTQNYTITEQLDKSAIDSVIKVDTDKLLDINSSTYENIDVDEDDISSVEVYRIRLAYNDCSDYGKAYEDLKKAQNELVDAVTKNASKVNAALTNGVQIGNVDLGNLSDDEKAALKTAVDEVVKTLADPAAEELKSWEENPKEILKDYYTKINAELTAKGSVLADGTTIMQIGDTANFQLINDNFKDISGAMTPDWTTKWEANQDAFSKLEGGPKIQFTDPNNPGDFMKTEWGGFAESGKKDSITVMHSYEDPYIYAAENDDAIVYIPETGEILLGKGRYETLMGTKDSESTAVVNEAEIRVTYDKSNWKKGDLRPEHYFYCEADKEDGTGRVTYNDTYLTPDAERQVIEYDVGYNQTIRINSTADECFKHGIGREVDDIVNAMQDVLDLEGTVASIENIMKTIPADDKSNKRAGLQKQLDAANKALTLAKNKEQKLFEKGITTFQKYHDEATLCVTNCGSRSSKLELIKNRSQNQKTTYETLKSENEDIDITEVAIELNAAELVYNAALLAAGKVTQTTLLNYI